MIIRTVWNRKHAAQGASPRTAFADSEGVAKPLQHSVRADLEAVERITSAAHDMACRNDPWPCRGTQCTLSGHCRNHHEHQEDAWPLIPFVWRLP